MLTKRSALVILGGLNFLLLALLVLASYSLPSAYAQLGARAGDFACVTAKAAGQSYDTLFVLDVPRRKLYAFYPVDGRTNKLTPSPPRDLAVDFKPKASSRQP